MKDLTEQEIREIVAGVLAEAAAGKPTAPGVEEPILVEMSARHVHLTREAIDALFGKGYELTRKRDLSQPGQFLSGEKVRLVTEKGTLSGVSVLGPARGKPSTPASPTSPSP